MNFTIRGALATTAIAAFSLMLAPAAKAQCGSSLLGRTVVTGWPQAQGGQAADQALAAGLPQAELTPQDFPPNFPGPSIVGLWKVTTTVGPVVVDQGFDAWHGDGTETLNDTAPGHFCVGVWQRTGIFNYKKYHPGFQFDASGNLVGTIVIREQVILAHNGNSYSGTQTVDFFDLNGVRTMHIDAQVTAQRLTADN